MNEQKAISRKLKVELWILGAITVLGMISWGSMMIVEPTPRRLRTGLGVLCVVVATWADGSYRVLLGLTPPQIYREFRAGRGPRLVLAAQVLQGLGLGLFIWAWLG